MSAVLLPTESKGMVRKLQLSPEVFVVYPTMFADSTQRPTVATSAAEAAIMSFFIFTYFLGTQSDEFVFPLELRASMFSSQTAKSSPASMPVLYILRNTRTATLSPKKPYLLSKRLSGVPDC
jgi:hypothetical protein